MPSNLQSHSHVKLLLGAIVTQLGDIKQQKVRLEALKKEAEEERQRAREAARERVLLEFEKGQLGLAAPTNISTSGSANPSTESGECKSLHLISPVSSSYNLQR